MENSISPISIKIVSNLEFCMKQRGFLELTAATIFGLVALAASAVGVIVGSVLVQKPTAPPRAYTTTWVEVSLAENYGDYFERYYTSYDFKVKVKDIRTAGSGAGWTTLKGWGVSGPVESARCLGGEFTLGPQDEVIKDCTISMSSDANEWKPGVTAVVQISAMQSSAQAGGMQIGLGVAATPTPTGGGCIAPSLPSDPTLDCQSTVDPTLTCRWTSEEDDGATSYLWSVYDVSADPSVEINGGEVEDTIVALGGEPSHYYQCRVRPKNECATGPERRSNTAHCSGAAPSPTPTPSCLGCNEYCSGLDRCCTQYCYLNRCRNPHCQDAIDCVCPTSTPTPVPSSSTTVSGKLRIENSQGVELTKATVRICPLTDNGTDWNCNFSQDDGFVYTDTREIPNPTGQSDGNPYADYPYDFTGLNPDTRYGINALANSNESVITNSEKNIASEVCSNRQISIDICKVNPPQTQDLLIRVEPVVADMATLTANISLDDTLQDYSWCIDEQGLEVELLTGFLGERQWENSFETTAPSAGGTASHDFPIGNMGYYANARAYLKDAFGSTPIGYGINYETDIPFDEDKILDVEVAAYKNIADLCAAVSPVPTQPAGPPGEVKEVKWSVGGQPVCWFSRVTNTKDRKCIRSWNRYPDCGDDFCPSENPNFECMEKGMNSMIIKNVGAHIEGVICNSYECNWCADNPTDDSLAQCDEEVGASPVETQTVTLQPGDEATCEFYTTDANGDGMTNALDWAIFVDSWIEGKYSALDASRFLHTWAGQTTI